LPPKLSANDIDPVYFGSLYRKGSTFSMWDLSPDGKPVVVTPVESPGGTESAPKQGSRNRDAPEFLRRIAAQSADGEITSTPRTDAQAPQESGFSAYHGQTPPGDRW